MRLVYGANQFEKKIDKRLDIEVSCFPDAIEPMDDSTNSTESTETTEQDI